MRHFRSFLHQYWLTGFVSSICILAQWPPMAKLFAWQRQLILDGQWWRVLTGNFTHTNANHLIMNLAAFWLICCLYRPTTKALSLCLVGVSLLIGIGLFGSEIQGYVGLSGTLHGLFAYGALSEVLSGRRSSWLLVIAATGKVLWEQWFGPSALTASLIQAPVAIQAHLIGLVSGFALALIAAFRDRMARS